MTKKPTILYVITQGGPWGGAQKYVYDLATAFSGDYNIIVAVGEPNGDRALQMKLYGSITMVQLHHLRRAISPWHDLLGILELRKLYTNLKPDIIHLNSTKAEVIGAIAYRLSLISTLSQRYLRAISTVHGWASNEPRLLSALYAMLEKMSARILDRIIVLSPQDEMVGRNQLHIPSQKITVIPHGIDPLAECLAKTEARHRLSQNIATVSPIAYRLSPPQNAVWIGAIANFYKTKGLDILIRAFGNSKIPPNVHLFILGDGSERKHLETLAAESPASGRIHMLGFMADAEKYLPAFDLLAIPSRKEGLPYALLSAMQAGVPVIASNVGGIPSLIKDNKTGWLVPPEDPASLAAAISQALAEPDKARTMAGLAREQIAPRTRARMLEATSALYRELLTKE